MSSITICLKTRWWHGDGMRARDALYWRLINRFSLKGLMSQGLCCIILLLGWGYQFGKVRRSFVGRSYSLLVTSQNATCDSRIFFFIPAYHVLFVEITSANVFNGGENTRPRIEEQLKDNIAHKGHVLYHSCISLQFVVTPQGSYRPTFLCTVVALSFIFDGIQVVCNPYNFLRGGIPSLKILGRKLNNEAYDQTLLHYFSYVTPPFAERIFNNSRRLTCDRLS